MDVPIEDLTPGTRVTLLNGHAATVAARKEWEDGTIVVSWASGPLLRHPHKLAGERAQVGSFAPRRPGQTVSVSGVDR